MLIRKTGCGDNRVWGRLNQVVTALATAAAVLHFRMNG